MLLYGRSSYVIRLVFFFFKQKTAYEMRISDWSSDVCSSDLRPSFPSSPPRAAPAEDFIWKSADKPPSFPFLGESSGCQTTGIALLSAQHQELGRRPTPTCRSGQGGTPSRRMWPIRQPSGPKPHREASLRNEE